MCIAFKSFNEELRARELRPSLCYDGSGAQFTLTQFAIGSSLNKTGPLIFSCLHRST